MKEQIKQLVRQHRAKQVANSFDNGASIALAYHRVQVEDGTGDPAVVLERDFEWQIKQIASLCRVGKLSEYSPGSRERTAFITFDDGYLDNLTRALPMLRKYSCPVTVFISTSAVIGGRPFWWDVIRELALLSNSSDSKLFIRSEKLDQQSIVNMNNRARVKLVQELLESVGQKHASAIIEKCRKKLLDKNTLEELACDPLVEIGAHTVNHVSIGAESALRIEREIDIGIKRLQQIIGQKIRTFAYPYGSPKTLPKRLPKAFEANGISCAVTTVPGVLKDNCNPFWLPRLVFGSNTMPQGMSLREGLSRSVLQ